MFTGIYCPVLGVLLYGPPGTGKTLLARACAAQTKSTFLKLAGPQLVQMFIGDGAKLVRDAFALAKEKQPAIIFIDELDAIGMSDPSLLGLLWNSRWRLKINVIKKDCFSKVF